MEALYLLLPAVFFLFWFLLLPTLRSKRLPPGPRRWPILGNILQLSPKRPHQDLAKLARVHGPLLSIRLGMQLVVVASSPAAAAEVFKTHDRTLSGRYVPYSTRVDFYSPYSIVWAVECDERWKKLRSICKTELFTVRTLDSHSQMREEKISQMVRSVLQRQGEEIKISGLVFKTLFNIVGNVVTSRDVFDLDKSDEGLTLKSLLSKTLTVGLARNVSDFYPALSKFDIQGLNKVNNECVKKIFGILEALIEERKKSTDSEPKHDFLSILLAIGFDGLQLKSILADMFVAGTETSTTAIEWILSEMIRNPEAMVKAQNELERVVGHRTKGVNMVKESHLVHLDYLHACIKESLRLHPVAPLNSRIALEDCNVMGYVIPKGCTVMVNGWAMGRDAAVWRDPEKFWPERFMESGIDYKGNNFEFTPFGAGRRICPGIPLASRMMQLIIASMIHSVDWSLPRGMKPEELDMGERVGIVLEKEQPLVLIPKPV